MREFFRGRIRTSAFWSKEIAEVVRQPCLIFTLVIGPFLVLLIFGLGYENKAPTFTTLFVAQPGSALAEHIDDYVAALGSNFVFAGVTGNQSEALDRLNRGEVDLVAVAPNDALEKVKANQQAECTIYQNELDPVKANWAKYYAYVYVNEVNRRVLASLIGEGKSDASKLQTEIRDAHANVAAMRQAFRQGDQAGASSSQQRLANNVDQLTLALGAGAAMLSGVQQTLGAPNNQAPAGQRPLGPLEDARANVNGLNSNDQNVQARIDRLDPIDQDLTRPEQNLAEYQNIDPKVVVSPFSNQVKSVLPFEITPVGFFAPAVLVLLLQHLAVTLGALSIVGERTLGTMELFRISPLSAIEALLGKSVSYLLFSGFIAAVLVGLVVFVLHVPMLGDWVNLALVVGVLVFASLGIGSVISLLSQTDSQAVQYTMLVLIAGVFFSGFIMSLESLLLPARVVSSMLPTRYGIVLLRDIMLRGTVPSILIIAVLAAMGLGLYFISWVMLRRQISTAQR